MAGLRVSEWVAMLAFIACGGLVLSIWWGMTSEQCIKTLLAGLLYAVYAIADGWSRNGR